MILQLSKQNFVRSDILQQPTKLTYLTEIGVVFGKKITPTSFSNKYLKFWLYSTILVVMNNWDLKEYLIT